MVSQSSGRFVLIVNTSTLNIFACVIARSPELHHVVAVCANGEEPKICHGECLRAQCDAHEAPGDFMRRGFTSCQADPCNNCKVSFVRKHPFFNPEGTPLDCKGTNMFSEANVHF